jgi:hypothetical protein
LTNVGYATLDVIPNLKGFEGHLTKGTRPGLLSSGKSGGTLFGDSAGKSAGARFGSVFKSAAKAGILGGLAVAAGAIKVGADAISAAQESQKIGRQTNAVIKSTGGASKITADQVGKLASKLSYLAGVDDELVQSSANVLLTFKNIRNEQGRNNKIFDRGAKVALNMSTALGTDLKGASIQVGKALNDPVKGIAALARVGVTFTKQQQAQIKALVEGGDANAAMALDLIDSTTTYNNLLKANGNDSQKVADILTRDLTPAQKKLFDMYGEGNHTIEAQKRILRELGSEFGGSARSQATASDRLKVAFGNVQESLGKGLLPIVQDFSRYLLREGVPAAQAFTDWFNKKGIPAIKDLVAEIKPLADQLLPAAADGFASIKNFAEEALPFAEGIVKSFNDMPGWVKKVLIGGAAGGLAVKKLGLGSLVSGGAKAATGGLLAKGSTPANPLYVLDVGAGLGAGKLGPGSKVLGALGKGGLLAAFGLATAEAIKIDVELTRGGLSGAGGGGTRGNPFGGPEFTGDGDGVLSFQERFGTTLDENRKKIYANKQAIEEFGQSVRTRIPRTIETKYTLLGVNTANEQARQLLETLLLVRGAAMDNRLDFGPSGSAPTGNTTPPGRSGRGVNVNIYGDVRPNDSKEFFNDMQRRSISGSGNGWK